MGERINYLIYEQIDSPVGWKTKIWNIQTPDFITLGQIRWYGRWRKYVFYPQPNTLFEQDCLRDIADFCQESTSLLRKEWVSRRKK